MRVLPSLSARDRRALQLGAWVLAPALLWTIVLGPYLRAVDETSERLAAERELLQRELELVEAAAGYPAVLEAGGRRLLEAAGRLFGGASASVASASVARYLQVEARASRVLLTRLEPVAATEGSTAVLALPVRAHGETDLEGLLTLLQSLEAGEKLVHVENLRVQGLRTAGASGATGSEVLTFEFTATGYMLAQPEGASASDSIAGGGE